MRYLEDRKILEREGFEELARDHDTWQALLREPTSKEPLEPEIADKFYLKVLRDKEFTYSLFDYLAREFDGDIFPSDKTERQAVQPQHLELLRRFLCGEGEQESLFLWAYDFSVVPIELISSIYEEFYHEESDASKRKAESQNDKSDKKLSADDTGSYYTPPVLVEWVMSQTLTAEVLAQSPRVLEAVLE